MDSDDEEIDLDGGSSAPPARRASAHDGDTCSFSDDSGSSAELIDGNHFCGGPCGPDALPTPVDDTAGEDSASDEDESGGDQNGDDQDWLRRASKTQSVHFVSAESYRRRRSSDQGPSDTKPSTPAATAVRRRSSIRRREKAALHLLTIGDQERNVLAHKLNKRQVEVDKYKQAEEQKSESWESKMKEYERTVQTLKTNLVQAQAEKTHALAAAGLAPRAGGPQGSAQASAAARPDDKARSRDAVGRKLTELQLELQKEKRSKQKAQQAEAELKEKYEQLEAEASHLRAVVSAMDGDTVSYDQWSPPDEVDSMKRRFAAALEAAQQACQEKERQLCRCREAMEKHADELLTVRQDRMEAQKEASSLRAQVREMLQEAKKRAGEAAKSLAASQGGEERPRPVSPQRQQKPPTPPSTPSSHGATKLWARVESAEQQRAAAVFEVQKLSQQLGEMKRHAQAQEAELMRQITQLNQALSDALTPPSEDGDDSGLPMPLAKCVYSWITASRSSAPAIEQAQTVMQLTSTVQSVLTSSVELVSRITGSEAQAVAELQFGASEVDSELQDAFKHSADSAANIVSDTTRLRNVVERLKDFANLQRKVEVQVKERPAPPPPPPADTRAASVQTDPWEPPAPPPEVVYVREAAPQAAGGETPVVQHVVAAVAARETELVTEVKQIEALQQEAQAIAEEVREEVVVYKPRPAPFLDRMLAWQQRCNDAWEGRKRKILDERKRNLEQVLLISGERSLPPAAAAVSAEMQEAVSQTSRRPPVSARNWGTPGPPEGLQVGEPARAAPLQRPRSPSAAANEQTIHELRQLLAKLVQAMTAPVPAGSRPAQAAPAIGGLQGAGGRPSASGAGSPRAQGAGVLAPLLHQDRQHHADPFLAVGVPRATASSAAAPSPRSDLPALPRRSKPLNGADLTAMAVKGVARSPPASPVRGGDSPRSSGGALSAWRQADQTPLLRDSEPVELDLRRPKRSRKQHKTSPVVFRTTTGKYRSSLSEIRVRGEGQAAGTPRAPPRTCPGSRRQSNPLPAKSAPAQPTSAARQWWNGGSSQHRPLWSTGGLVFESGRHGMSPLPCVSAADREELLYATLSAHEVQRVAQTTVRPSSPRQVLLPLSLAHKPSRRAIPIN